MIQAQPGSEEAVQAAGLIHNVADRRREGEESTLVLLVHGRGGNAGVMWTFARAVSDLSALIIAPQAHIADPEIGGFSWWEVHAAHGPTGGPPFDKIRFAADRLEAFVKKAKSFYRAENLRVIAIGFSQGGALISALALRNPEIFSAVCLLASFVPRGVFETPGFIDARVAAGTVQLPPFFVAHGARDEIIPLSRADESVVNLRELGATVEMQVEDVAHKVGSTSLRELASWIDIQLGN